MKNKVRLVLLFIATVIIVSCKTDFNVNADYKEVAVVYGLLNQHDSIHYLRINKAFLGTGNALEYSQIPDSSSFGGNIDVVLEETLNNGTVKKRVFDTITLSNKESGEFYSPTQLFYYYKDSPHDSLNPSSSYELKIKDRKTGYTASSKTMLIHSGSIANYGFRFITPSGNTVDLKQAGSFEWKNALFARRYQLRVFFRYKELNFKGDTTRKRIIWTFPEVNSDFHTDENTDPSSSQSNYGANDFLKFCESNIPYSDQSIEGDVKARYASTCDLELTAIGDEYCSYLDANGPTSGVLMEKPSYSNITNGIGFLSSRHVIHLEDIKTKANKEIPLSPATILFLSESSTLKFAKPAK